MPPRVLMISLVKSNTRDVKTEEKGNGVTSWKGIVPPFPLPHPTHSAAGRTGGGGLEGRGYCLGRRHCLPPTGVSRQGGNTHHQCGAVLCDVGGEEAARQHVADESSAELGDAVTLSARGEVRSCSCSRALACFLRLMRAAARVSTRRSSSYLVAATHPARPVRLQRTPSVNTTMLVEADSG